MKKLLGIMAVVALLAVPVMAAELPAPTADVPVAIHVDDYCAIMGTPQSLVMTANDIWHTGVVVQEGLHAASGTFNVQGNRTVLVTLTTPYVTTTTNVVPGGPAGGYPTFYTGGVPTDGGKNGIGVGVSMYNITTPANVETGWNPALPGSASITFQGGLSQGKLAINSYIDSGRSDMVVATGKLAGPGDYTGKFILTLTTP